MGHGERLWRRLSIYLLLASLVMTGVVSENRVSAAGDNMLSNPGFESGSTSWELWSAPEVVSTEQHSGSYSLSVQQNKGGASTAVAVVAGKTYEVGLWVKFSNTGANAANINLNTFSATGEGIIPISFTGSVSWEYQNLLYTPAEGVTHMRIAFWNDSGVDYFIDDAVIREITDTANAPPAPANVSVGEKTALTAELAWDASTDGSGITEYIISYQPQGEPAWHTVSVPSIAEQAAYRYTVKSLIPSTPYSFRIQARNSMGVLSAYSETANGTTLVMNPVNPNATAEARGLLNRLYSITGKGILSGQHNYYEDPNAWSNKAAELSGFIPGLWGSDFAFYTGGDMAALRQTMIDAAEARWRAGSVIALTYHQARPTDSPYAGWSSVQGSYTNEEMEQVVTPGTEAYNSWLARIDEVAEYLKELQAEGVPVLWRPYHEMNANFFWWGGKPELFKQLWINMYERYTDYHQLNNLIWVWNPNAQNQYSFGEAPYYPGHDYVDAVAMDIYNNDYRQRHHDELLAIGEGRLMAIAESGEMPNIDVLRDTNSRYAWFMTWPVFLTDTNSLETIQYVYGHEYTINAGATDEGPYVPPVQKSYLIDDFEGYGDSDVLLSAKWRRNMGGNELTVTLNEESKKKNGQYSMQLDYTIGDPAFAGTYTALRASWKGTEAIRFWLKPDGSNRQLSIQFHETTGEVWEAGYSLSGIGGRIVTIPFTEFAHPGWYNGGNDVVDPDAIKEFGFYFGEGAGGAGSGSIYIDNLQAINLDEDEDNGNGNGNGNGNN